MIKIYFTNNWGEKDDDFLKRMLTTTENCLGKWKNICYTKNIKEADFVLSLGGPPNLNFDKNKIIVLQREPLAVCNFNCNYKLAYSYEKLNHAFTHPEHMQLSYDDLKNINYKPEIKTKKLSTVTSMRLHTESCNKRVQFITNFCKKYNNCIDVFGSYWDNRLGESYKGPLDWHNVGISDGRVAGKHVPSKYDGLREYKYSFCFENSSYENYFTEKFTDCILSWTIPIYWGCKNIDVYFPKDCYYYIDIYDENSIDKVIEIINTPITNKNIKALEKARELILEKYNVWDIINDIANEYHT